MSTLLLDTNVFIIYLSGLVNLNRIGEYSRNSFYNKNDYKHIASIIKKYDHILVSPNIKTEIDNILNHLRGDDKYNYTQLVREILNNSSEEYVKSVKGASNQLFRELGLSDCVILDMAKNVDLMVSADSQLCDYAKAQGINVLDYQEYKNKLILYN